MSNNEVDKLKLHNDEVDKQKNLREKKRTGIQKRKLIDTPFAKSVLSENLYILILFCEWWSTFNLFSNRWPNWCYPRSSFTRNISTEWLRTRQEKRRPNNIFSKKDSRKSKMDLILPIIFAFNPIDGSCYKVMDSSNIQEFFSSVSKMFILQWRKNIRVEKRFKKINNEFK